MIEHNLWTEAEHKHIFYMNWPTCVLYMFNSLVMWWQPINTIYVPHSATHLPHSDNRNKITPTHTDCPGGWTKCSTIYKLSICCVMHNDVCFIKFHLVVLFVSCDEDVRQIRLQARNLECRTTKKTTNKHYCTAHYSIFTNDKIYIKFSIYYIDVNVNKQWLMFIVTRCREQFYVRAISASCHLATSAE